MARYELLDEMDLPFPLGGCFGYWGYDLKNFVEPKLPRRAVNDLELPDCHVGFYDSLVVFDHRLGKTWVVSTGLDAGRLAQRSAGASTGGILASRTWQSESPHGRSAATDARDPPTPPGAAVRTFTREQFLAAVDTRPALHPRGDIYQVNLPSGSRAPCDRRAGWELFERLAAVSPAPFAAYLDCGDFQIASSSPELFLRLSGAHIADPAHQRHAPALRRCRRATRSSPTNCRPARRNMAELVMITDLLRNDLGRVCEYGSVQVPELVRLERFAQVQHLVSTVEGRLRPDVTHFAALAACFPGGSITGAPKIPRHGDHRRTGAGRARPVHAAPGLSRLQPRKPVQHHHPHRGLRGRPGLFTSAPASWPIRSAAEYEETLAKAQGFFAALNLPTQCTLPKAGNTGPSMLSFSTVSSCPRTARWCPCSTAHSFTVTACLRRCWCATASRSAGGSTWSGCSGVRNSCNSHSHSQRPGCARSRTNS